MASIQILNPFSEHFFNRDQFKIDYKDFGAKRQLAYNTAMFPGRVVWSATMVMVGDLTGIDKLGKLAVSLLKDSDAVTTAAGISSPKYRDASKSTQKAIKTCRNGITVINLATDLSGAIDAARHLAFGLPGRTLEIFNVIFKGKEYVENHPKEFGLKNKDDNSKAKDNLLLRTWKFTLAKTAYDLDEAKKAVGYIINITDFTTFINASLLALTVGTTVAYTATTIAGKIIRPLAIGVNVLTVGSSIVKLAQGKDITSNTLGLIAGATGAAGIACTFFPQFWIAGLALTTVSAGAGVARILVKNREKWFDKNNPFERTAQWYQNKAPTTALPPVPTATATATATAN